MNNLTVNYTVQKKFNDFIRKNSFNLIGSTELVSHRLNVLSYYFYVVVVKYNKRPEVFMFHVFI